MLIKATKQELLEGLKKVTNIVEGNSTVLVMRNVKIDASGGKITLTTTNLDRTISTVVEGEIVEDGATTLPAKTLQSIVGNVVDGIVSLEVDDKNNKATIKAGSARFKLSGLPVAEFPSIAFDAGKGTVYEVNQSVLKKALDMVDFAASQDDTRRTLQGVNLQFSGSIINMAATDGRRLATTECPLVNGGKDGAEAQSIIIPSKSIIEIKRLLDGDGTVKISIVSSQVKVETTEAVLYSKLVEDKYPNIKQVIPSGLDKGASVDRELFLQALDRVSILADTASIKLTFSSNAGITLEAESMDVGSSKDEVPCKYEGETVTFGFNPQYLKEPIKRIDDDEFKFSFLNATTPATITCSVPYLYLVMPLRSN